MGRHRSDPTQLSQVSPCSARQDKRRPRDTWWQTWEKNLQLHWKWHWCEGPQERPITSKSQTRSNVINSSGWKRTLQNLRYKMPPLPGFAKKAIAQVPVALGSADYQGREENQIRDGVGNGLRTSIRAMQAAAHGMLWKPSPWRFENPDKTHRDGFGRADSGLGHQSILERLLHSRFQSSHDPFILMNLLHVKSKWKRSIQSVCD